MEVDVAFLQEIRQNAEAGQGVTTRLLEEVTDVPFRRLLQKQCREYTQIFEEAERRLQAIEATPDTASLQRRKSDPVRHTKTVRDKTPDHIAEMLMQGSLTDMIRLTRRYRQYEARTSPEVRWLAEKLLQAIERNLDRYRSFLG